jgi:hypothetical protein
MNQSAAHTLFGRFFGVIARARTSKSLLYLFLSFPLGILFFVFMVTCVAVAAGLIPVIAGLPLLAAVFLVERGFLAFERRMLHAFFREEIPRATFPPVSGGVWRKMKSLITDSYAWQGVCYFVLKFFLSTWTFIVSVGLISVSVTLAFLPLFLLIRRGDELDNFIERAWDYPLLIIGLIPVGLGLIFVSLHTINGVARLHIGLGRRMLKR